MTIILENMDHKIRKTATWIMLVCFMLTTISSQAMPRRKRDRVLQYFQHALQQDQQLQQVPKYRLKPNEINNCRKEVWQLWVQATRYADKNICDGLLPLEQADTVSWHIPDSLEPHAWMTFYRGTKGDGAACTAGRWAMFLYLHGSGPKAQEWATGLKLGLRFDDAPSLYFIPRIPNESGYYRWWQRGKQYVWKRLLREVLTSGYVDANRLYVFGISEGGYGSQRLASFYADYWAAAGPMAGGEPLINAPAENCSNLGFSLLTGSEDHGFYRNQLTKYTKAAFDSLQRAYPGFYSHRIALIPGAGHGIDYTPTTPWLKDYVRNPYPKFLNWENFEMDGAYRDGFYNLQVLAQSDEGKGERTRYLMRIEGNTVHLNVDIVKYQATEVDPKWGIELNFRKSYRAATRGKMRIYLSNELVDLSRDITLLVNGKKVYQGRLQSDVQNMVNSCVLFSDPYRIYPAAITIDLSQID